MRNGNARRAVRSAASGDRDRLSTAGSHRHAPGYTVPKALRRSRLLCEPSVLRSGLPDPDKPYVGAADAGLRSTNGHRPNAERRIDLDGRLYTFSATRAARVAPQ